MKNLRNMAIICLSIVALPTLGCRSWAQEEKTPPKAAGSAIVDENTGDVMVVRAKGGYLWRSLLKD